jgi:pilus assembly protein FimV
MLCCTILLAAAAQAKTLKKVYLKTGGIIECQKVWRSDGKVMILVNRDTLVDLAKDEVDLKKTFSKKPPKAVKKVKARKKAAPEAVAATPQAAPQQPTKPGVVTAAAQEAGEVPEAKPAAPTVKPAAQNAKPATQTVKPAASTAKPAASTAKPAASTAKPAAPTVIPAASTAKSTVQGTETSTKKPAPGGAVTSSQPQRPNLALAKPAPPPPPQKSFLETNMVKIALVALLVLLLVGYLVYKKRQ